MSSKELIDSNKYLFAFELIRFAQELRKTIEVRNPNVPSPGEYEIPGIISTIPSYLLVKRKDPY